MNKRRLLKLADLLEADAKNKRGVKFDLSRWGFSADRVEPAEPACGTYACAIGLAVLSGAFQRAGLRNFHGEHSPAVLPAFGGAVGFTAAAKLFGIAHSEAEFMFHQDHYPSTKISGATGERYVAKRIRDFVAGKVHPETAVSP
jgi:hypothetical protein